MLIIGLPALLIALFVMGGLWRDAGREAEAQAATASARLHRLAAPLRLRGCAA